MGLKYTITANIPFPSGIVGDAYTGGDGEIKSSFPDVDVDFDIQFTYEGEADPEAPPPAPGDPPATVDTADIIDITIPSPIPVENLTITKKGLDTVNFKGKPANIFTDEIFEFLFPDKSKKVLPSTNTENWDVIVRWAKPGTVEKKITYSFKVKYDDNAAAVVPIVGGTVDIDFTQYFYWKFEPSLAAFQDLVKKGKF